MSAEPIATWTVEHAGDVRILIVRGELDLSTADLFREAGEEFASSNNGVRLAIDLAAVTFIDSTGLRALLRIHRSAPTSLVLRNPSRSVRRILQLTVPGYFTID